jgi:hypothetical protein
MQKTMLQRINYFGTRMISSQRPLNKENAGRNNVIGIRVMSTVGIDEDVGGWTILKWILER